MATDWKSVRSEFPALENWTFLNTATFGQLPQRATEAMARHLRHRDETACWDFLDWFDDADRIRNSVARLIHSTPKDIAFIPNASSALGTLMNGMTWRAGDQVVTLADEFPNNIYAPAVLERAGVERLEVTWDGFFKAISHRTRLVVLSTVNYTNGFRPPLDEVTEFVRKREIPLYVDGTQSVGALRFDVSKLQPSMLAVNAYKWLLGPTGSGFVYVHPECRKRLAPAVIGWRSHKDWRRVDNLHHGAPEFVDAAEKYEGGMLGFPALYGMAASVDMMLEIGPEAIEQRVTELAEKLRARLRELGAKLLFDEHPHYDSPIVAARFPGKDASELARALKERRVLVSVRHGNLRISTHFYNSDLDLDALQQGLESLL